MNWIWETGGSTDQGRPTITASSLKLIGADIVHAAPFDERGSHAVIGVVDDGIDILHEAFLKADNKTRIVRIWDQSGDDVDGSTDVPFGRFYSADEINEFIENDDTPDSLTSAHGTRVTSIAAGNKVANADTDTAAFQGGVAPEAGIIFVKRKPVGSDNDGIGAAMANILALNFIIDSARAMEMPCAINLSFGTNVGAHDGTSLLEYEIDSLCRNGTAPGICFVKSAGNEQASASQASLELSPNETADIIWNARSIDRPKDVIDIWFKTIDRFKFRLFQPEDLGVGFSEELSFDKQLVETELPNGNHIRMAYRPLRAENGDCRVTVEIFPGMVDKIKGGDWRLEIVAASSVPAGGVIHAWLERDDKRPIKFKDHSSKAGRITIPGTARSVVTVGAVENTANRKVWKSSSRGPTRDGRLKPDFAAPGAQVHSALSNSGDQAGTGSGTSYASPHAVGAIALLLSHQKKRGGQIYNALQIQTILTQNCFGFDGRWRSAQGYGVLDIGEVFRNL